LGGCGDLDAELFAEIDCLADEIHVGGCAIPAITIRRSPNRLASKPASGAPTITVGPITLTSRRTIKLAPDWSAKCA